jgi:SAM-dependent methyltransferase
MILDPDTLRSNLLKYTTLAFSLLPKLHRPNILDAGCGTGVPTIHLAELSDGTIVAIDTDQAALAKLTEKLAHKGLSSRVNVLKASMQNLPFRKECFDVVWAEGSISHLGFHAALELLGQYVKTDGFVVLHDDAGDYLHKISMVQNKGFLLLGFFLLSDSVWWDEYYKPLGASLASADSACPPHTIDDIKKELERFGNDPKRFQSAFFVTKKTQPMLTRGSR